MEEIEFLKFENSSIEGYLNENKDSNGILIILKEPDSPDGINIIKDAQTNPYFWFYNQVNQETNHRYCKILSSIVENVFNKHLKQCSYINISPFFGASSETDFYKNHILNLKNWQNAKDTVSEQIWFQSEACVKGNEEECAKKNISNRLKLIEEFINAHENPKIITVRGIYENLLALDKADNKDSYEQVLKLDGIKYSVKKRHIKLFNKKVELCKIYHPAYHFCSNDNINRVLTDGEWY